MPDYHQVSASWFNTTKSMSTTTLQPILTIAAPWGRELLLQYQNKFYICTGKCQDLNQAAALTQSDRQAGFDSIMMYDQGVASLWCALPIHLQTELHRLEICAEIFRLSEVLTNLPIEQRSWLDIVRHLSSLGRKE
jgi:hypothetical protein